MSRDHEVNQGLTGLRANREPRVRKAHRALGETEASPALWETGVLREPRETLGSLDLKANRDLKGKGANQDLKVSPEHKGLSDHRGLKDQ